MRNSSGLPEVQTEFFAFGGGLDLTTPALLVRPGFLFDCLNYESTPSGGYSRIQGYERLDGRPRPADATYLALGCTLTSPPAYGATVACGAASGSFVQAIDGGALLGDPTGTFIANTPITVSGVPVGYTSGAVVISQGATALQDATWQLAAANYRRSLISAPPGGGPSRGAWVYKGTAYAFRDNAAVGPTACLLYQATAAGWVNVPYPTEISFIATATASPISVGETVKGTTSGATGIVRRVCWTLGVAWGINNTGRLVIDTVTGTWQNGETVKSSVDAYTAVRATTQSLATAVTFAPGGAFRFLNFNFYGDASSLRMYGVDGKNRAFEFDGVTVAPISTGAVTDTPSCLVATRSYLYLGLASAMLYSAPGEPTNFNVVNGAGQLALGDTTTALQVLPGQVVAAYTRQLTMGVYGTPGTASFTTEPIAPETGALANTVALLTDAYGMDRRGVTTTFTTQHYGNFEYSTVSRPVQPLIDQVKDLTVCAVPVRKKNHYRLFLTDGRVLCMRVRGSEGENAQREFTVSQYPFTPFSACSVDDPTTGERVLVCANDGFVYELERGGSFDGADIEAYLKLSYWASKSPKVRKRFRRITLEMTGTNYANLDVYADYSYGDPGAESFSRAALGVLGAGGNWDVASWDSFSWDSQTINNPSVSLTGTGTNLSLTFYSKSALDLGHTLQGALLNFTPQRLQR